MKIKSQITPDGLKSIHQYEVVSDITERDNIPNEARYEGMPVFVLSQKKTYRLIGGTANSNWQISGMGDYIGEFNTFADLPPANTNSGKYAVVLNSSGVWLVNRREKGWYRSDGTNWSRMREYRSASEISFASSIGLTAINTADAIDEAAIKTPTHILRVGKDFAEYKTIKDAVDVANILASSSNNYTVCVTPGEYKEDAITVNSYVNIKCDNGVKIIPTDPSNPLFNLNDKTHFSGGSISDVTGSAAIKIGYGSVVLDTVDFYNSSVAVDNSNGGEAIIKGGYIDGTVSTGISTTGGSTSSLSNLYNMATTAFSVSGSGSVLWVQNSTAITNTTCINIDNNAKAFLYLVSLENFTNGIVINNNSELYGSSVLLKDTTANTHINQADSNSIIRLHNTEINEDKLNITNWQNVSINFINLKEGSKNYTFSEDLNVGLPEVGRSSYVGEGEKYTRQMFVYTDDGTGTFTDVTSEARSSSGSTFTFPNNNAGSSIYVSTTLQNTNYVKFYGIEYNVTTGASLGTGSIIAEYWNGGTWVEFDYMVFSESLYQSYGKSAFTRGGKESLVFSNDILGSWMKSDPVGLGVNAYWIRFRIASNISQAPVFEQFKLITSSKKTTNDGWTIYYGKARPITTAFWSIDDAKAWSSSPSNQDLYMLNSTNGADYDLGVGRSENLFEDGVRDRVSMALPLPYNIDTSNKLVLDVFWIGTDASSGDIDFFSSSAIVKYGDIVATSVTGAGNSLTDETAQRRTVHFFPSQANKLQTLTFEFKIPHGIGLNGGTPSHILAVSFGRDGGTAADTYSGNVAVLNIQLRYTKWCEGGHL